MSAEVVFNVTGLSSKVKNKMIKGNKNKTETQIFRFFFLNEV